MALSAPAGANNVYTSKSALLDFYTRVLFLSNKNILSLSNVLMFQVHVHHGSRSMQHRAVSV